MRGFGILLSVLLFFDHLGANESIEKEAVFGLISQFFESIEAFEASYEYKFTQHEDLGKFLSDREEVFSAIGIPGASDKFEGDSFSEAMESAFSVTERFVRGTFLASFSDETGIDTQVLSTEDLFYIYDKTDGRNVIEVGPPRAFEQTPVPKLSTVLNASPYGGAGDFAGERSISSVLENLGNSGLESLRISEVSEDGFDVEITERRGEGRRGFLHHFRIALPSGLLGEYRVARFFPGEAGQEFYKSTYSYNEGSGRFPSKVTVEMTEFLVIERSPDRLAELGEFFIYHPPVQSYKTKTHEYSVRDATILEGVDVVEGAIPELVPGSTVIDEFLDKTYTVEDKVLR